MDNSCVIDSFFSYICGKLLGDDCITIQQGRRPRFQFTHTSSDFGWSNHCFEQLRDYIPLNPPKYGKLLDKRVKMGFTERYIVQSKNSDIITYLNSIWYINKKGRTKVIPFDFLEKHLDERTLAWWYQDDGHLKVVKGMPSNIILSTDNFTPAENQKLIKLLEDKFSLSFSLDGQNRLVLYSRPQVYYFCRLVGPHIHPSMDRKMIDYKNSAINTSSRTTSLYLPIAYNIVSPTKEINNKMLKLPELYNHASNREMYLNFYGEYILPLKKNNSTRPYRIIVKEKHWEYIRDINAITGLNGSQIVSLCFSVDI